MQVGDLAMLAKWCKTGPCLMHVVKVGYDIQAMYMQGPLVGTTCKVAKTNLFTLEEYEVAMRRHDSKYGKDQ